MIAMLAAAREKRIASLVLMATGGSTGAELILEQQGRELDRMKVPEGEKAEKVALQKQIQAAVIGGSGWEALPEDVRKQADTPWFRSLLLFDPATTMPKLKQPILVPATTGDVKEYPELKEKSISPEIASTIAAWLKKSQP